MEATATIEAGPEAPAYDSIPDELKQREQWVVWRYGEQRSDGKRAKDPYSPRSGRKAQTNQPRTWATYAETLDALTRAAQTSKPYDGIGFVLTAEDLCCGVDLDHCHDPQTGAIEPWAQAIIARLRTYTEVSPSGTGVRLMLRARKPGGECVKKRDDGGAIEVYDHAHYLTLTGQHLPGTPTTVEDRQAELSDWYHEVFPLHTETPQPGPDATSAPTDLSDEQIIAWAKQSANGPMFARLWDVGDISGYGSASEADMALCGMLAFWTGKDAEQMDRLFRQSGLMRDKWDERRGTQTYGALTIAQAIANQDKVYTPGSSKRADRRIPHAYAWQRKTETPQKRERARRVLSAQCGKWVQAHLGARDGALLIVTAPPGSGKSKSVAALGAELDLAWFSERHDMAESIPDLGELFNHPLPPSAENCPQYKEHRQLARQGYNTWAWHAQHDCQYAQQFSIAMSTLYMVEHAATPHPAKRADGAVIDELTLTKWLPELVFTGDTIRAAAGRLERDSGAEWLLDAIGKVLADWDRAHPRVKGQSYHPPALHGRDLFDALNQQCIGDLAGLVGRAVVEMGGNPSARQTLTREALERPEDLTPPVAGALVAALRDELDHWQQGGAWNSQVRTAYVKEQGWILGITQRRTFREPPAALALLDATANQDITARLFRMPVRVEPAPPVDPPPHMRHYHCAANRYGITSLTRQRDGREVKRAISQALYLMDELDPDRTRTVALITHQGCEAEIGEALGIPKDLRGHFWAERGSNRMQDADILLVIGTPAMPPDEVERLARALYADDPQPIRDAHDERVERLSAYLTNAELTQCAHRNRPLWHDGRVVVTLCQGEIGSLPVTDEIIGFPQLEPDGTRSDEKRQAERDERLETAYQELLREGRQPSGVELARRAQVRPGVARAWLKARQAREAAA